MLTQAKLLLRAYPRGFHLITNEVVELLPPLPNVGICHLFIQHTSAAITINENADPTVLMDFESVFNKIVPENMPFLKHTIEGPDDMPAHIKAALIGSSVVIPITNARLNFGTWQGIYLCEFRNHGGRRRVLATIYS